MFIIYSTIAQVKTLFIKYFWILSIGILGLWGGWMVWQSTTKMGIGITLDSVYYLRAAENIAAGKGYVIDFDGTKTPLTHYPPGYSLLLAPIAWISNYTLTEQNIRVLHTLLYFLNLFLSLLFLFRISNSYFISTIGIIIIANTSIIYQIHLQAWSEGLFILLLLLSLHILLLIEKAAVSKPFYYFLLGTLLGLLVLTRYIGIVWVFTVGIGSLFFTGRKLKENFINSLYIALPVLLIVGGWLLRNQMVSDNLVNRDISFEWMPAAKWIEGAEAFVFGWLPFFAKPISRLPLGMVLVLVLFLGLYRLSCIYTIKTHYSLRLIIYFLFAYLLFLIFSIHWIDHGTHPDTRLLAPWWSVLILVIVYYLGSMLHRLFFVYLSGKWWQTVSSFNAIIILIILPIVLYSTYLNWEAHRYFRWAIGAEPGGLVKLRIDNLSYIDTIARLPENAVICAYAYDPVYLYWLTRRPIRSGRPASDLDYYVAHLFVPATYNRDSQHPHRIPETAIVDTLIAGKLYHIKIKPTR